MVCHSAQSSSRQLILVSKVAHVERFTRSSIATQERMIWKPSTWSHSKNMKSKQSPNLWFQKILKAIWLASKEFSLNNLKIFTFTCTAAERHPTKLSDLVKLFARSKGISRTLKKLQGWLYIGYRTITRLKKKTMTLCLLLCWYLTTLSQRSSVQAAVWFSNLCRKPVLKSESAARKAILTLKRWWWRLMVLLSRRPEAQ